MKDQKTPENSKNRDKKDIKKELKGRSLFKNLKGLLQGLFQGKGILPTDLETVEDTGKSHPSNKSASGAERLKDRGIDSSMADPSSGIHQKQQKNDSTQNSNNNLTPFIGRLKNFYIFKSLKTKKDIVIKTIAIFIGILFIIFGLIYSILGSPVTVSSNVIFGERATFSAFLVLIGFLILAGVFARKLLELTFLKRIYRELEIAEGKVQKNGNDKETVKDKSADKKDYKKD